MKHILCIEKQTAGIHDADLDSARSSRSRIDRFDKLLEGDIFFKLFARLRDDDLQRRPRVLLHIAVGQVAFKARRATETVERLEHRARWARGGGRRRTAARRRSRYTARPRKMIHAVG